MSENPCYVVDEKTKQRFETGACSDCVDTARLRVKTWGGRFGVYRDRPDGYPVCFNIYPDADLQWADWQRRGLVAKDDE